MIVSGAILPIIMLANSGSFETKVQCMSILQRMLLGKDMPEEVGGLRKRQLSRASRKFIRRAVQKSCHDQT